ncbi:hypothetical protein F4Z99_12835 [Candidatus Poribacteria bacterium]|nr:hypothetical protein [Candidatus Poribacteria bacterium]MYB00647.1 hypothetical protein [Candidatus Poribacteria bacterium]
MKRLTFYLTSIFFGITLSFSAQAQGTDLTKNFGIGLQGATPTFGGISFRYTGLAPVYLQTVGRFILSDQDSDHMLGAGISYAIFEHQSRWNISRLYFTLEGAWQYEKRKDLLTTRLGGGIAFGGELVFSLGGIPLGLNVEVGQGFGREEVDSGSKGLAGVYVGTGIHAYF